MRQIKKAGRWFADLIEVYLPIAVFVALFLAFLTNVFFRYVVKDPQNWTFEFSVNAFVVVGLLGACIRLPACLFPCLFAQTHSSTQSIHGYG